MSFQTDSLAPPSYALWLINLFACSEDSESLVGDMQEEFSHIASTAGVAPARRWFWRQTLATIPYLFIRGFLGAPLWTATAVVGGFLLMRTVSRLPEMAIFALLAKYRVFEKPLRHIRFLFHVRHSVRACGRFTLRWLWCSRCGQKTRDDRHDGPGSRLLHPDRHFLVCLDLVALAYA